MAGVPVTLRLIRVPETARAYFHICFARKRTPSLLKETLSPTPRIPRN